MPDASSPKLLDQVRQAIHRKHYSIRTEDSYVNWIRRFILFHMAKQGFARHPAEMGKPEAEMNGVHLMSQILYGCGLRLMECVRLIDP
jgi:hypothetical protein